MILWKDKYATGVEGIDEQHKRLFELAGDIYELLNNDMLTDKYDQIVAIIQELKEYTVYHFRSEEEYMWSKRYRRYFSHKIQHLNFLDQVNGINLEHIDASQDQALRNILEFICNWLVEHILKLDKRIAEEV